MGSAETKEGKGYTIHHVHIRKSFRSRIDEARDKILPGTTLSRTQVLEHIINSWLDKLEGKEANEPRTRALRG